MTEVELIQNLADHMKQCRETCRALAHMRKDERWIKVSAKLDYMREQLMKLAVARS
jgi:hypothetical protein